MAINGQLMVINWQLIAINWPFMAISGHQLLINGQLKTVNGINGQLMAINGRVPSGTQSQCQSVAASALKMFNHLVMYCLKFRCSENQRCMVPRLFWSSVYVYFTIVFPMGGGDGGAWVGIAMVLALGIPLIENEKQNQMFTFLSSGNWNYQMSISCCWSIFIPYSIPNFYFMFFDRYWSHLTKIPYHVVW